ncbi:MAG: TnsA endonuclease N-terminal domain-containing protein [Candidatus Shapirobacteria bacterium]
MSWIKNKVGKGHTIFVPKNLDKFVGTHAVCRSSWERKFCEYCDKTSSIILWSSESIRILYYDVVKKKSRSYYPDFMVRIKTKDGNINNYIIEIKPEKECKVPARKKNDSYYLKEWVTYTRNLAKWKAADEYCKKNGIEFKILTEKSLGIK